MLDLKFIRENVEIVRNGIHNKNEKDRLDELLELDAKRRALIQETDDLKSKRNKVSEEIAKLKKANQNADDLIAEMKLVSDTIKEKDEIIRSLDSDIENILLYIPNIPHSSVKIGKDSSENTEVRSWGRDLHFGPETEEADFEIKDHVTLGKKLGILDFERAAKISGSGFPLYIGKGAILERGLIQFMLNYHIEKHGYTEVSTPFIVNRDSMRGTGQIPKLEEDMYHCEEDDLFLIPTAEVPITNIFRNEMLNVKDLPIKFCGYSPCFRREAGSYGKETKGFLRVHQFNKVEMVKFSLPENSYDELELLVNDAEDILKALEIPYRVLALCTGDLSFSAAKCYDIEVYSPAEKKWLEASSCSNFEDFQARRANIRFKRDPKSKPEFVHTLNGSGLATSRLMVALLENYQTSEGKIIVPKVLQPYTQFNVIG
ncbi:MAG TPA: serine--tRNA ligase [Ignavibacteria bacterium]